jgi:hypothetical protein
MKPTNHGAPLRTRHAAWESFLALAAAADGGTSRGRWAKKATSIIAPVAALATLAVLAAGCGGGSSSPGVAQVESGNSTTNSSAAGAKSHSLTAFTKCMRSHGILLFPDPNSNGQISPSAGVHLSSPLFRKAQDACKSLLPRAGTFTAGGARLSPQQQAQLLRYAKCMRAHGLTKFPDPGPTGAGVEPDQFDPNSPQFKFAQQACRSLLLKLPGGQETHSAGRGNGP